MNRRSFLRRMAGAAGALAAVPVAKALGKNRPEPQGIPSTRDPLAKRPGMWPSQGIWTTSDSNSYYFRYLSEPSAWEPDVRFKVEKFETC